MGEPNAVINNNDINGGEESASATNSSITLISGNNIIANGSNEAEVKIILKSSSGQAISNIVPRFEATDTRTDNIYTTCSSTDSAGESTCKFTSETAEIKTLSISYPIQKSGDQVTFIAGAVSAVESTIQGTSNIDADGVEESDITITLRDAFENPISGITPTYTSSGGRNTYNACSASNASGVSTCTMTSTRGENKILQILTPVNVVGSTIAFNNMGIDLVVPIEILSSGIENTVATPLIPEHHRVEIDTASYVADDVDFEFEVIFVNNMAAALNIDLLKQEADLSYTVVEQISVTQSFNQRRARKAITTFPSGKNKYFIRLPATLGVGGNRISVHSARVIVKQNNALETKIQVPILFRSIASGTNPTDIFTTNSATYTIPAASVNFVYQYLYDTSLFSEIEEVELHALISGQAADTQTKIGLFNVGANAVLASSEISNTGTAYSYQVKELDSTQFVNNASYEIRMKKEAGASNAVVHSANLWIKLENLNKAQIRYRLDGSRSNLTSDTAADSGRLYFEKDLYSYPVTTLECKSRSTAGLSTVHLVDDSTYDVTGNPAPATVANSSLTLPTTLTKLITPELTLTNNNRYRLQFTRNADTINSTACHVIINTTD